MPPSVDADLGANGRIVEYRLVGGPTAGGAGEDGGSRLVQVDPATGVVRVGSDPFSVSAAILDDATNKKATTSTTVRETTSEIRLLVAAFDGGKPPRATFANLTVELLPPPPLAQSPAGEKRSGDCFPNKV
jgi:hypothetical protein